MKCLKCKAVMPFNEESPKELDCIFCDGKQYPDAVDLLTEPTLQFVNEVRQGQIKMADEIVDTLEVGGSAMFEAGTGVGKSFAYLLPAVLSGKRTIISTAKIALQTQLIEKDLPHIKKHLVSIGHPFAANMTYAPAYGKGNFACELLIRKNKATTNEWPKYENFLTQSKHGLWSDGEKMHLRLDTSLNAQDCIGTECRHYKTCGYVAARKEMLEAQVVVTNNWLLGYHYRLRREMPHYYLLGDFEHIIVDEAHKIEDGIRTAFTYETSLNFLDVLENRLENLNKLAARSIELPDLNTLIKPWNHVFMVLRSLAQSGTNELSLELRNEIQTVINALKGITDHVLDRRFLDDLFVQYLPHTHKALIERWILKEQQAKQPNPNTSESTGTEEPRINGLPSGEDDRYAFLALEKLLSGVESSVETFQSLLDAQPNRTWALEENTWRGKTNLILKDMPINIGMYLPENKITYVSATLALDDKFDDFAQKVGLRNKPYKADIFPSPFNLQKQAHLYIPARDALPSPDTKGGAAQDAYRDALSEHIHELIYACRGDAFVLFSSKAELAHVKNYLHRKAYPYPIIAQGDFTAAETLQRYRNTPQCTLLGLKSFWEGVDVTGDKLFLVIITKLPFPNKSDPVINAKRAAFETFGEAFTCVDVPEMLFDLRQGVGRLIRTQKDRGMIALLDTRIHTKPYGKKVLRTIGLRPYHDLAKVCRGLASRHG